MGVCPNCGNWVDDGDICGVCGGSRYSSTSQNDNSYEVKSRASEKINRVRYIINSEMSYDNANLLRAEKMLREIRDDIDRCLNQSHVKEETGLKILKIEIEELKEKISIKIERNNNKQKNETVNVKKEEDSELQVRNMLKLEEELRLEQEKILEKFPKSALITIAGTYYCGGNDFREGMDLNLVKEPENTHDRDAIAVYHNNRKVGYVANSDTTNCRFCTKASELKHIGKVQYLMQYGMYHIARIV